MFYLIKLRGKKTREKKRWHKRRQNILHDCDHKGTDKFNMLCYLYDNEMQDDVNLR